MFPTCKFRRDHRLRGATRAGDCHERAKRTHPRHAAGTVGGGGGRAEAASDDVEAADDVAPDGMGVEMVGVPKLDCVGDLSPLETDCGASGGGGGGGLSIVENAKCCERVCVVGEREREGGGR